jgi:hypothetical protein
MPGERRGASLMTDALNVSHLPFRGAIKVPAKVAILRDDNQSWATTIRLREPTTFIYV